MRITNSILINNMMNNITKNMTRMDKYQTQMATGKKISVPSDDPVVAARALKLRTDLAENEQYQKNVTDATSWLETTESTLGSIGDVLHRVNELAVKVSNGSLSASDEKISTEEIKQLRVQLMHLGNTTYAGRYIFSGFKTDQKLMDESAGTFNIGVTNTENINYEIGIGDDININVLAGDLFNYNGTVVNPVATGGTPEMIDVMDDLVTAMNANDKAGVSSLIARIQQQQDNVTKVRADVGARTNRLELSENRLDTDNYNFTKLMSTNEDVDMAEVIMHLKEEENVYKSSLSAGARIIQPSLVDFLR